MVRHPGAKEGQRVLLLGWVYCSLLYHLCTFLLATGHHLHGLDRMVVYVTLLHLLVVVLLLLLLLRVTPRHPGCGTSRDCGGDVHISGTNATRGERPEGSTGKE
jgi:hypothetical protein